MSANSGQFLHSNLKFAMQYIEKAPPEAQKSLIQAMIKEIVVYKDYIGIKMYIDQPTVDSLSCSLPAPEAKKALKMKSALQGMPARRLLLYQTLEVRLSLPKDELHNLKRFTCL